MALEKKRRPGSRPRHEVDPLETISKDVGRSVCISLAIWGNPATDRDDDTQAIVSRALERCLKAQTPAGRVLRFALLKLLLETEPLLAGLDRNTWHRKVDELMTTAAAAELLDVSRPHVVMLADIGKLGEVRWTEGGHRRLRTSAVLAYLHQQDR